MSQLKQAAITITILLALAVSAAAQHSVKLTWVASTMSPGGLPIVGYHAYRGTATGGPYSQINIGNITCCTYTDSVVSNGATYYYTVRASDGIVESGDSNEVKAVIPQAPAPPTSLTDTVH